MGRVIGGLAVLLLSFLAPVVLVAGAIGAATSAGTSGSSGPLVAELSGSGLTNGRLPDDALAVVSTGGGHVCRVARAGSADLAWRALVDAARADGVTVEGGFCYRSYDAQAAAYRSRRCDVAGNCDGDPYPPTAEPGTSLHGWGLAVDVWGAAGGTLTCSSAELGWLALNGPRFGWVNPDWARCGRPGAEPWHWEYVGTDLFRAGAGAGP